LRDQRRDVDAEIERLPEVAGEYLAEPDRELRRDRLVEPEARSDLRDLLRVRGIAGEDRRRIPGREPQQQENEDRDDQEDRDRREQPACDELGQFFLMFQ
jgi:hypothetical protein